LLLPHAGGPRRGLSGGSRGGRALADASAGGVHEDVVGEPVDVDARDGLEEGVGDGAAGYACGLRRWRLRG
jgi:hypothetical protein